MSEDKIGITGVRYFFPDNPNADREIQMPASVRLEDFLIQLAEGIVQAYKVGMGEAVDIISFALDEMEEEGLVPTFPENGASEKEIAQYLSTIQANAGVMEKIADVAVEVTEEVDG